MKMKKRSMFFRMITASILRRRSKIVIALLSIAIGATILSGLVSVYRDVPRQMGAQFRNYGANMLFMAEGEGFSMEELQEGLTCIPDNEIVGVTPFRYENVRINDTPVVAAGTDMQGAQATSPYWSIEGAWPEKDKEVLLGASVADQYALKVGDSVSITYTPDFNAEEGETEALLDNFIDCHVAGIVTTGGSEEDYLYMSLENLEELTGTPTTVDLAELSVSASGDRLSGYADQVSEQSDSINARLVRRVTASEATVLSKLQALVLIVTVIVLALTMICVATTMTAVVTERRKEIGLRKALGATDKEIIQEFMGEGMILGAAGGLVGAFLGYVFAQFVSSNVFGSTIAFSWFMIPLTIIISIAVTALACLLPIRSATDIDPALVLKGE